MPVDTSIYFQQQAPDLLGGVERGLRMGDMIGKRKEEDALKGAFKAGVVTNPDGTQTVDHKRTMAELYKVNPEKAMAYGAEMEARDAQKQKAQMEKQAREIDLVARAAGSVRDQGTYEQALSYLGQQGVDISQMPRAYDPNVVNGYRMRALSAKEQLDAQFRQQELEIKRREANGKGGGGKAPQGYRFKADGSGALEPIPGGPDAVAADNRKGKQARDAGLVVQEIGRSLDLIEKSPSAAGTGDFGLLSYVPGSPSQSLDSLLESVKSNIGFDKLQAMREASPTGGALGSVSEKETAMLQATAGKLSSYMPEDQLKDNLKRLANQYNDIIHGPGAGPPRHQLSFDEQGKPVKQSIVKSGQGQTKVVDGISYRKVQGGWEEIPTPAAR